MIITDNSIHQLNDRLDKIVDHKEPPKNIYDFINRRPFLTFFLVLIFLQTIIIIIKTLRGENETFYKEIGKSIDRIEA